ncbi:unnamed protein product [Peronospora farinosa]|uniref:Uncharacterized protein n=1 Tax=Peronospora farinosa TaxID=134698 RepID=A0AAV0U2H1_9STRA|nr:unnamed protein product [Peronospora farinosa]CAI5730065.1 unnamed protein product [Peronospora farinosa]
MNEDAASSASSTNLQDRDECIRWSSAQSVYPGPHRSVLCTTEKSVVFRVRTQEKKQSSGGGKRASDRSSTQTLRSTQRKKTSGIDDTDIHETLAELYAEVERKKMWLNSEEKAFQCGQQRLSSLQREHAMLLHNLEQCKRRRKERLRIEKMVQGPRAVSGRTDRMRSSDSDSNSDYCDYGRLKGHHRCSSSRRHHRSQHDGARKERKRLRQFQSEVSLRFQLLESECRGSDLKVDKLVADLRREYADSCLFGNSLNF